MTPWSRDEIEWARECVRNGDTQAEIAAWSGRPLIEVRALLGSELGLTPTEREVLSLYMAGATFAGIDATRGACANGKSFASKTPGKAAAAIITNLRKKKRLDIPYREAGA